jgi:ribonuclease HI
MHQQTNTLLPDIINRLNQNFFHIPLRENNPITTIQELPKPPKCMQKLQNYPITTITDKKQSKRKDKLGTIKIFTSYKCKWMQPENHNYTMWLTTDKVFPHNQLSISTHNITLPKQYYLTQQHKHYLNIIENNFHQPQSKDTRYVHEPLYLPLIQINLNECNPDIDINTTQPTIQITQNKVYLYTNIGIHLITIHKSRLEWLWKQYNTHLNTQLHLDPPPQPFEIEIIWLYERYKYRLPNTDPLKRSHYTLPPDILHQIITKFKITTSYFSSPVTCPT